MNYDNNPFAAYNKLWCDLANARLEVDRWKQLYANEMERNLSNVANADLQIAELQAEITRLRDESQAMVSRLTTLDAEWQTIETYDKTADGVFETCARRLREAIGGEGEK